MRFRWETTSQRLTKNISWSSLWNPQPNHRRVQAVFHHHDAPDQRPVDIVKIILQLVVYAVFAWTLFGLISRGAGWWPWGFLFGVTSRTTAKLAPLGRQLVPSPVFRQLANTPLMHFRGRTLFTTQIHFDFNTLPSIGSHRPILRILTPFDVILNGAAFALAGLAAHLG